MRFLALVLALFAFGCAAPVAPIEPVAHEVQQAPAPAPAIVRGSAYNVVIDPSLTAEQIAYVLQGLDAWTAAAPGLALSPVVGGCDGTTPPAAHTVCIVAWNYARMTSDDGAGHMGYTKWYDADNANVVLDNNLQGPGIYPLLTMHELGHAFGLEHTTDHDSVMDALLADGVYTVTCRDVAAFWALRGQSGHACVSVFQ